MSISINQIEEFVLNRIERFKGNPIEIEVSSSTDSSISYTFRNIPKDHNSRVNYAAALARFMITINHLKFGIFGDESSDSVVEYSYLSETGFIRRELISCNTILNYRVKLIPDKITITCDERDLHPWIGNKIFTTGESTYKTLTVAIENGTDVHISSSPENILSKYNMVTIKEAAISAYPVFNDPWLLELLNYHDYLKNVVIGFMRMSMMRLSIDICRSNMRNRADWDGDLF